MKTQEAEQLAFDLLDGFELQNWTFKWDNAKRRFGQCQGHRKIISLSKPLTLLNDKATVEDVIRHEIAHALDVETRGTSDHGPEWKEWAVIVGANPVRGYDSTKIATPKFKYYHYCPTCKDTIGCRKRKNNPQLYSCPCGGNKFKIENVLITNIPADKMEQVQTGGLDWTTLKETQLVVNQILMSYGEVSLMKSPIPSPPTKMKTL